MNTIDISKLDKADVLVALFNASKQQGMGVMDRRGAKPMTKAEAQEILKEGKSFDYLWGRVMKVSLDEEDLYPGLYDRDNGQGAAERAINAIRGEEAK